MRLSGVQASFPVGALDGNKEKIAETLTKIEEVESDIAIFPELALTGYPPEDLMLRESFVGKNYAKLEEISALSGETAAIIGLDSLTRLIQSTPAGIPPEPPAVSFPGSSPSSRV